LLFPLLQQPVADTVKATGAFFHGVSGIDVPPAPRLTSLVDLLLSPPRERESLGKPVPEPELAPLPDPDAFSSETWQRADSLLAAVDAPRRLSGLLDEARRDDGDLAHLVALRALHAVSPPVGSALQQKDNTILIAVDDGERLADLGFGGADLLLGIARINQPAKAETVATGGSHA
jgi:hypothetical protein